ncbi:holliday junction DNA helicase RuvA [Nautilia profundicola AmH]|uniref:Holliday junction branch migration complex subunit RuvA n=1 Tax=Nautilia profundicola (strain ATCC BAA-1463 / DSM 18972 / AmH) TaxID=598659 RepID=RUVA_NAUPA|nr:Holliday junction branch migration protein RuvA [Nautilia profundicola]B9L9P0.1 RecName: Full=Holliday junction branch migration complex subunit RuvA [Nautilia profundicola AmH]ACM92838.1 holliday junction DNA helicase RuvA [Nautilia profundicola AmH]
MIAALRGNIFEKDGGKILLDVNNVIYELNVSMITFSSVNDKGLFYITEIIKENEYTLYGFADKNEKKLFDSLIKLNGVGPKVALAICSTYTPQTFMDIIANHDINALKKIPGIGPKSAKRILMEMGEFEVVFEEQNPVFNQALSALESLGFNKNDIVKALNGIKSDNLEETIKLALKKLSKDIK